MLSFLAGDSDQARRVREHDWTATPIGDPEHWPAALKTLVGIILDSNQPMFVVWGPEQTLIYNDGYRHLLGGKHPAALGQPILAVWREVAAELRDIIDQAYAGTSVHMDDLTLYIERNGYPEETHFSFSYTPIRHEGGGVDGFFCACNEITRAVLASRAITDSEARNRQIFDSAIDYAIIATDLDGRVTRWNEGAQHVLGWTEEEMRGQIVDRIFTPEDLAVDRPRAEMRSALEQGRGNDERWHLRASGERFFASGEMTPLRGGDDGVIGFVKVLRDRTEQRLADDALRASRGELDAALAQLRRLNETLEAQVAERTAERDRLWEASPDLLVVLGFDGTIRRVNPAWTTILGYAPDDLAGRNVEEFVVADDVALTRAALARSIEGPLPVVENRYRHKDGSVRCFSWVGAPTEQEIYAIGRHVTGEKEAAEALRRAEDQLRQAQKVEAVGQLTGGVAHDFNNLLTVIRGSAEMLARPTLSEERRAKYVKAISDTADRATKLTSQLLAFARRQALRPELFDVGHSVTVLQDMMRTLAGSRIRIDLDTQERPCLVHADRSQFDTAIVNMAVNARDAMGGEGTLTIRVRPVEAMPAMRQHPAIAGDFVAISIVDTGTGIPADRLERIFEPFYTTKDVGEGTGLGLSQVFGFAKQSGGEVEAESEEGHGSTFTLYLPRSASEHPYVATGEVIEPAMHAQGACVLVVEDNAEVGAFATSALAELGYTTVLARDAAHALGELEFAGDRFDVVFSDVVMPGMSGIELGQEIRKLYPDLPVILTSGYSTVLARNGSYGFELIHKPYSIEQLSRALRKVADWRRRKRPVG